MDKNADFTTGSIPKKLVGFMIPILGALVLQAMYSAVDLMIVGQFGTTEGISGVSTGASIIQVFTLKRTCTFQDQMILMVCTSRENAHMI